MAIGLVVAAAYVLSAKLGFRVALVADQVTTVWAPTGLAEATLILWGRSLWPAIWLGAFVANVGNAVPVWAARLCGDRHHARGRHHGAVGVAIQPL